MKKLRFHSAVAGALLTGLVVFVATASAATFSNPAPITIPPLAPPAPRRRTRRRSPSAA